jgi:class 3 adenylate cyclase
LESAALATERVERKLAAILAADVAGYSRLMGADEEGTLARLKAHRRELIDPRIAEHRGRIVKTTGDGMAPILTAEDVVRRSAAECAYVDERGGVGIRLEPAAAIVRRYGEQFRRPPGAKTDRKDARGIAQLMRLGCFRSVHCNLLRPALPEAAFEP